MFFRMMGAALLLALSLYFCRSLARMEQGRVRQTEGILLLLRSLRTHIACFRTPTDEIYAAFENPALAEIGFLATLREAGLAEALSQHAKQLYLDEEELKLLSSFAEELGKSYCDDQLALCDYAQAQMEAALARRRAEAPARTRATRSLVLTGGLMLILVLL